MPSTLGAGLAPAGTSYAGYGSPATASAIPTATVAAGLPNVAPANTALIDPGLRAYTYDGNGNRVYGTTAAQMVYLACVTVQGSSSLGADLGLAAPPAVIDANYISNRTVQYQNAFAPLLRAGIATFVSITIQRSAAQQILELVTWRDLSTGQEAVITF